MDYKAEKITPYGSNESKTEQVREMFDSIAPVYDFMNRAMTFGIDKLWRRKAVKMMRRYEPTTLLDVATGTGDFAMLLCRMSKEPASMTSAGSRGRSWAAKART